MPKQPDDEVPDLLRKRILRQRRRLKIVRFTFALTAALSVLLLFVANQSQSLAPTARAIHIVQHSKPMWLLDQHFDYSGQQASPGGSFAIVKLDGDKVTSGTRYDGLVRYATAVGDHEIGITTPSRYMTFDVSGDDWKRGRFEPLGLNDRSASPVVVPVDGELWLCWVHGRDVMVRPLEQPDVEPKALHKTSGAGAALGAEPVGDTIWLTVREIRSKDLTLISFAPGAEQIPTEPPDDKDADDKPDADENTKDNESANDPDKPGTRTTVQVRLNSEVTGNVSRSALAVIGDRPVVGVTRNKESDRTWTMMVWTRDEKSSKGRWVAADPPPRKSPPSGLELSNFVTLSEQDGKLLAIYNDGAEVKQARATLNANGSLEWGDASLIPIDETTGATGYIVWVSVLFGMLLLMASQGVWLLLNRERPMDRTLAEILERQDEENGDKEKKKELPKLMYANGLARALALLLDIALTSPLVILLQGVYGYTFGQAYGFLAIGSIASLDADILPVLLGTVVTLGVLSIYGMVCEQLWGKTFGKAMFRLRVVNADGEPPSPWRIVVRNVVKIVELIHWVMLLLPMGLMMMTGKQQRLGDLLAGTYVIVDVVPEEMPDDIDA